MNANGAIFFSKLVAMGSFLKYASSPSRFTMAATTIATIASIFFEYYSLKPSRKSSIGIQTEPPSMQSTDTQSELTSMQSTDTQSELTSMQSIGIQTEPPSMQSTGIQTKPPSMRSTGIQTKPPSMRSTTVFTTISLSPTTPGSERWKTIITPNSNEEN